MEGSFLHLSIVFSTSLPPSLKLSLFLSPSLSVCLYIDQSLDLPRLSMA